MSHKPVTKQQFLSNSRSAKLRKICLSIADSLDALLHDPKVARSSEEQQKLYVNLEKFGGQLIALGITKNIHVGDSPESFDNNPVKTAEYVAGQLLDTTGAHVVSESKAMPMIQEFSEHSEGRMHVLSGKNLPNPIKDFMVMRSMVNVAYRFLDAAD